MSDVAGAQTSNEQIFRAIGSLEAEVKSLRRDIQQAETRADTHRAAIHERVDDVAIELKQTRLETAEMAGSFETIKKDLAETKIVTDQVKVWQLMGAGALLVTGLAAGFIGWFVSKYSSSIAAWWMNGR